MYRLVQDPVLKLYCLFFQLYDSLQQYDGEGAGVSFGSHGIVTW